MPATATADSDLGIEEEAPDTDIGIEPAPALVSPPPQPSYTLAPRATKPPMLMATQAGGPKPPPLPPFTMADFYPESASGETMLQSASHHGAWIPQMEVKPQDSPLAATGKTAGNMISSMADFATSPAGVLATVATGGGGLLARLVTAGFSLQTAKSVYDQQKDLRENWSKMTPGQQAAAIANLSGTTALAGTVAAGAVHGVWPNRFDPVKLPQAEIPPELQALAQKAKAIGMPQTATELLKTKPPTPGAPNAIQERSPAPVPLGPTPGNRPEVGGRVPEPETPAETQKVGGKAPPPGPQPPPRPVEVEIAKIQAMTPDEQTAYFRADQSLADNAAYRLGRQATTPEEVQALEKAAAEMTARAKAAKSGGDPRGASILQTIAQNFREAHEAATGTGSAGYFLKANDPNYKPPVPMNESEGIIAKKEAAASVPKAAAQRLQELKALTNPSPAEIAERDQLQKQSNGANARAAWGSFGGLNKPAQAPKPEQITAAAYRDPQTGQVTTGAHHPGILAKLGIKGFESRDSRNTPAFGYVTDKGRFVTRPEAASIAEAAGQKMEAFDVDQSGQPQPHSDEIAAPGQPGKAISETKPSRKTLRAEQPADILDALEATGKINIASAREIRPGYNPPPAARKLFDFQNQSGGIDKVLQGVQESAVGDFSKLTSGDELLDAIDAAGPARQGARNAAAAEARQAELDIKATGPVTSIGQQLDDWADKQFKDLLGGVHSLGPNDIARLTAAIAIRGARLIQRGITDFTHWSREMIKQYGEDVKPHLASAFEQAKQIHSTMGEAMFGTEPPKPAEGEGEPVPYGVAARVREARAKAGQVVPVPPGEGVTAEDSIENGEILLEHGADPENRLAEFEKTSKLGPTDIAITRAHGRRLQDAAEVAKAKFGHDSPEYQAAFDKLSSWDTRTKRMQTAWHVIGQEQQSPDVPLDVSSAVDMEKQHKANTGEDFTPQQTKQADEVAGKVKVATDAAQAAQDELFKQLPAQPIPPGDQAVWKKVREYIASGDNDYKQIIQKVATELGMKFEDVAKAIARNKTAKRLSDDVWRKQQVARQVKQQAQRWFNSLSIPGWSKALNSVPRAFFGLKVGFGMHGFVGLGTHAPSLFYQPRWWTTYFPEYGKMYGMVFNTARHEVLMNDLTSRPNWNTARRAGLANDPQEYEEYANIDFNDAAGGALKRYISARVADTFNKFVRAGNRGYSVLKILRQDMFDKEWSRYPDSMKQGEAGAALAKSLADSINHDTGIVNYRPPKVFNWLFFAPRLESSRAMWLYGDPLKATGIALNWKNASVADRAFATRQFQQKAWVAGTYLAMLAANQGMLTASGSKQKINGIPKWAGGGGIDPLRSDFMKFKVAGQTFSYGNAMLSMARLPVRLLAARFSAGSGKMKKLIYADESQYTIAGDYLRSQASPFGAFALDLQMKADFQRRPLPPMPFSGATEPMPKRLAAQGEQPYTWPEFLSETASPIPIEEAQVPVWRDGFGMSDKQIHSLKEALIGAAFMSASGGRMSPDTLPPQK